MNTKTLPKQSEIEISSPKWVGHVREFFWALVIISLLRIFIIEPYKIPTESMVPTLQPGDFLFVKKFQYGYNKHSIWGSPDLFDGQVLTDTPKRGDIIVFYKPKSNPQKYYYIKRLIGLPGDTVQVINGHLYINGEMMIRERNGLNLPGKPRQFIETLPEGQQITIQEISDNEQLDDTVPFVIPEGKYFFMGDNRDRSQDSRVPPEVGFVPFENIIGKAWFIWFSYNSQDGKYPLYKPWTWHKSIQWDRLGQIIQ